MFFLPPLLLAAAAVSVVPGPVPLRLGEPLACMRGELLTGTPAALPEAARGRCTLLVLGFTVDSRIFAQAWSKRFRSAWQEDPGVTLFEIAVLGGVKARLAKPIIESRMRDCTPQALRANVMSVWGAVDEWKVRLDFRAPEDAYLVLLDGEGRVAWRHAGPCEEAAWDSLDRVMHGLRDSDNDIVAGGSRAKNSDPRLGQARISRADQR